VKRIGMLFLFFIVMLIAACGGNNSSELGSEEVKRIEKSEGTPTLIMLTCHQALPSTPCRDVEFDRSDEIRIVTEAIFSAERMKGDLNYAAEYKMDITYANGSVTRYDLSLGADPKMQGLLVNQEDTSTGYSISLEDANRLRQIIQRRTD